MATLLGNRSIAVKLAVLCWLPVAVVFVLCASRLINAYQEYSEADNVARVLSVAPTISNLVHELQKERGTSAGYLSSKGAEFLAALKSRRGETDAKLAVFRAENGGSFGPLDMQDYRQPFERAVRRLSNLAEMRKKVDRFDLTVSQMAQYYTGIIADLLRAIESTNVAIEDGRSLRELMAYTALLQAKERAGLERTMGTVGFGSETFKGDVYRQFVRLGAEQDAFLAVFRRHAAAGDVVIFTEKLSGPTESRVRALRQRAYSLPFGGDTSAVSGPEWFATSTARIEAMKDVEDRVAETLKLQSIQLRSGALTSFLTLLFVLLALVGAMVAISLFVYRSIVPPLSSMVANLRAGTREDAQLDLIDIRRGDEIGELARTFNEFNKKLQASRKLEIQHVKRERETASEMKLLSDLNEWVQSTTSIEELFDMISTFMERLFPECRGSIYVYSNSRDVLNGACAWNGDELHAQIRPDDCWALRRGQSYSFRTGEIQFACGHTKPHDGKPYSCLPIVAHGETVGLLHFSPLEGVTEDVFFSYSRLAQLVSEQISLAIANSRMRDQLHQQSIRDPLTGLFNRRHFIELLRSQIEACRRTEQTFCLISVDVDHFKRFNDIHGHDAGDMVLRAVGDSLERSCDANELPCRIGGEEFMILLPETTIDRAQDQAEIIRRSIERITVRYGEKALPRITASLGIAVYPDHGVMPQDLMKCADDALYASKASGRNQVTVAKTAIEMGDRDAAKLEFDTTRDGVAFGADASAMTDGYDDYPPVA
ncbi:MAG: nitrate- and nitrite sensing domain-containing protein [Pseudomonadota bacterium]